MNTPPPYNQHEENPINPSVPPPYVPSEQGTNEQIYQQAYLDGYKQAYQDAMTQMEATNNPAPAQGTANVPENGTPKRYYRRRGMGKGLGCAFTIVGFMLLGSIGLLFNLGDNKSAGTAQPVHFATPTDSSVIAEHRSVESGSKVWTIDDVPMAHLEHKNEYVSDPDGYLTASQKAYADSFLYLLEHVQRTESAFILVGHVPDKDTYRFAIDLGRKYGISSADEHRGVTVVIAVEDRKYTIATSQGVQGVLTDMQCNRIAQQHIIPHMKAGRTAAAVIRTSQALYYTMADGYPHLDGDSLSREDFERLERSGQVYASRLSQGNGGGSSELTPAQERTTGAIGTAISLGLLFLLWKIRQRRSKMVEYYDTGTTGSYRYSHNYSSYSNDDDDDDYGYSSSSSSSSHYDGGSYGGDSSYDGGGSSGGW
ncbi:MAG: TPM domain-containing protein [Prevotella sp.]|nr:TPM domain-containing protein [Prevotella sp.]